MAVIELDERRKESPRSVIVLQGASFTAAAREPLHGETVRAANRRTHERALALYRELYR